MKKQIGRHIFIFLCLILVSRWGLTTTIIRTDPQKLRQTEQQLLELLNGERSKRGLNLLKIDKVLKQLALGHSRKMSREQKLSHDFPGYPSLAERMRKSGLYFTSAGENVSFSNTFVASYIHKGFMDSPPHRQRILDHEYSHCGITIVESAKGFWVTQEFAQLYCLEDVVVMEANINQLLRNTMESSGDFSKSFAN